MNDTDIEIILALAQDHLSGQAKADALAHIQADPDLTRELSSQIAAIKALRSLEPPQLTDQERTVLRAELTERLHLETPRLSSTPARRSVAWWRPMIGLASAAALVLAIIVVPGLLNSGRDEASADFTALAQVSPAGDDGAARSESAPTSAAADSLESLDMGAAESGTALFDEDSLNVYEITEQDLPGLLDVVMTEQSSRELSDEKLARYGFAKSSPVDLAAISVCLDVLFDSLPDVDLMPLAVTTDERGQTVHFGVDSGAGVDSLVSVDLGTCSVVGTTP